jgi:hypothetical protein
MDTSDVTTADTLASHTHKGILSKKGWFDWSERFFVLEGKKLAFFKNAKVCPAIFRFYLLDAIATKI